MKLYRCDECGTVHASHEKAVTCCGVTRIARRCVYHCTECGEAYEVRADAIECCAPVSEVEDPRFVYGVCPACKSPIEYKTLTAPKRVFAVCENVHCPLHGRSQRTPYSMLDLPVDVSFDPNQKKQMRMWA
jgi:hypothetical protein